MVSMVKSSGKKSKKRLPQPTLVSLMQNHPILFWGSLLTVVLTVASVAALGLFNPDLTAPQKAESPVASTVEESQASPPTTIEESEASPPTTPARDSETPNPSFTRIPEPPPKAAVKEGGTPLWLFGAIALSCTMGSLLLARKFNLSQRRQRSKKLSNKPSNKPSKPTPSSRKKRPYSSQKRRAVPPSASAPPRKPSRPKPVVTILSPQETHPLDRDADSLAEIMDIRKRQSLSSILNKK